jgi:hypothetical protein
MLLVGEECGMGFAPALHPHKIPVVVLGRLVNPADARSSHGSLHISLSHRTDLPRQSTTTTGTTTRRIKALDDMAGGLVAPALSRGLTASGEDQPPFYPSILDACSRRKSELDACLA